ncbi:MAG: RsmG family class I SAM-dependent methyltransferase, partial [Burkholderiaceae bacterium]
QQRPGAGGRHLLDVGAEAGLPGVVVAICCPHIQVACVDAVAKKMAFVRQAQVALGLTNVQAHHARVETLSGAHDIVCSRAFSSLVDFVKGTCHLMGPGAFWLAMKGQEPVGEMIALPSGVAVFHVEPLVVPGLDAQRCIVWMEPTTS